MVATIEGFHCIYSPSEHNAFSQVVTVTIWSYISLFHTEVAIPPLLSFVVVFFFTDFAGGGTSASTSGD